MTIWVVTLLASTVLAAAGFVVVAVLWLRKLRDALATTVGENTGNQIRSTQRLAMTVEQLLHRQELYEKRLLTLTDANIKMRQDLNLLAERLALSEGDTPTKPRDRILH